MIAAYALSRVLTSQGCIRLLTASHFSNTNWVVGSDQAPEYRSLPPPDRLLALQEQGLTDDRLHRILEAAYSQASSVDGYYASNARGTLLYHHSVGELCATMHAEAGWSHTEKRNQKRIISPDQAVEVIVVTGDYNTGIEGGGGPQPNNKNSKRRTTQESVAGAQLTLPEVKAIFPEEAESVRDLWIWVIHDNGDECRWEISRPEWISEDGMGIVWGPRHCGPAVSPYSGGEDGDGDGDGDGDIDVPVTRK